jgi:hypothetical protein
VELVSHRLPNAIDRHVASRSRQRRVEAGLTQTTLADALGISFQQLQKDEGPAIAYLLARFITLR